MLVKQKLKYIQTLGQKKVREQEDLFIAEGPKIVKELLEANASSVKEVYALKEWINDNQKLLDKVDTIEISEIELQKISQLTTPNKVVAVVHQYKTGEIIIVKDKVTIVLDGIQDPGNLGTIIRIADWFDIEQIVCSIDSADMYNPKVVQATMGSIARVKVYYVELEEWLDDVKDVQIYAATLKGNDVASAKKINEGILIFGNESKGISPEILKFANQKITISGNGKAESLNAAVATGIVLSHIIS